ncbi:TATA-binding protein-associated factor 172 [Nymphon striatum]|nr:TATA-binding protein-associated factor 172 [Nymphon striatum]
MVKEEGGSKCLVVSQAGRMKFSLFDMDKVLNSGTFLLGSEGKEYEQEEENSESTSSGGMDAKEKLACQRQLLNKKLGLDVAEKMGIDTSDIFTNEDLVIYSPTNVKRDSLKKLKAAQKRAVAELVEVQMSQISGLSSREMNRAKRKARIIAKQKSKEATNSKDSSGSNTPEAEPPVKKLKSVLVDQSASEDKGVVDNIINNSEPLWEENTCWPFESFCDQLCQDLFSPSWETRHGASTALREVIKIHGKGAGRSLDVPCNQMDEVNQLWLEDIALRLLCVMALDRFGDFISDQVVAPVRETCAQVLGSVFNLMWKSSVQDVLSIILQLLNRPEWEVRHGGLLAMKYLLAVRQDMTPDLLPITFVHIYRGLSDPVDDVVAVAASALIPVCNYIIEVLPKEVPGVISCLWDSLLELDDLCASTSSIMALLASLLSHPAQACLQISNPLNELVPRLWPFLCHASTVVRKCVLETLLTLTLPSHQQFYETWIPLILPDIMRHVYQRCILEHNPKILNLVYDLWKQLLTGSSLSAILTSACPWLSSWLCLMMQPAQIPIDPNSLLEAHHKGKNRRNFPSDDLTEDLSDSFYIGGECSLHESLQQKEESVIRARCMASRLLGLLSCYVSKPMPGIVYSETMESPIDCYAKLILFHLNSKSALQRFCVSSVVRQWAIEEQDEWSEELKAMHSKGEELQPKMPAYRSVVVGSMVQLKEQSLVPCPCPASVKTRLLETLSESLYYDEIAVSFTSCQQECTNFMSTLKHYQLPLDQVFQCGSVLTLDQALNLCQSISLNLILGIKNKQKLKEVVQAATASALTYLKYVTEKLNPIIRPIMESIKKEENNQLQKMSSQSVTLLLELCLTRNPCPNPKIIKNLSTFLCSDEATTPRINFSVNPPQDNNTKESAGNGPVTPLSLYTDCDNCDSILTLVNLQKDAERISSRRINSVLKRSNSVNGGTEETNEEKISHSNIIQRDGAVKALTELCLHFGNDLPLKLPKLWEIVFTRIDSYMAAFSSDKDINQCKNNDSSAQELVFSLQVFEVIGPALHTSLQHHLESHLPHLSLCLRHQYSAVRHMASRCFAVLSKVILSQSMGVVLNEIQPYLTSKETSSRLGAIECLAGIYILILK